MSGKKSLREILGQKAAAQSSQSSGVVITKAFSRNTMAVAAAATSGAKVKEYNRTVERTLTGAKNVVAFALEEKEIDFSPDFAPERIKTSEVLRRMRDEAWLQANPSHPIASMAYALDTYKRLIFIIKDKSPILVIPQVATSRRSWPPCAEKRRSTLGRCIENFATKGGGLVGNLRRAPIPYQHLFAA